MIFEFEFMRRAFYVGALLSLILPSIGTIVVLKRMSLIGDALSHTALAGVALGFVIRQSPLVVSFLLCIVASLLVGVINKNLNDRGDIAIAVISSLGIGLAGVLSGFIKNASAFNAFLFGSIVSISDAEIILITAITILVLFGFLMLYKELMYMAFDEEGARISGVNVPLYDIVFVLLTALTVSISSRTVGALIVTSLIVLPVATSIMLARSYKSLIITSILLAFCEVMVGLTVAYYFSLKPGGTIAILSVIIFSLVSIIVNIFSDR